MPPDHERLAALLFRIMYFVRTQTGDHRLPAIRDAVAKALRENDRGQVGLKVLSACDRIIDVIDHPSWRGPTTFKKIEEACAMALARPKVGAVNQKTWEEQLAGRTRLLELNCGCGPLF